MYIQTDPNTLIYTSGCIEQGELWVNQNLIPVAGVFVGLALVQVSLCWTSSGSGQSSLD